MFLSTDEIFEELYRLSRCNDAVKVASLLQHKRQNRIPSLDELVLKNSEAADRIYKFVFVSWLSQNMSDDTIVDKIGHGIRALLMSPLVYELPWKTAVEFIAALHSVDVSRVPTKQLRFVVPEIQHMLQHAVASWWDQARRLTNSDTPQRPLRLAENEYFSTNSARHWILRLVCIATEPLLMRGDDNSHSKESERSRDYWETILDVVATAISLCRDFDSTLFDACLASTLRQTVRPCKLLPWVDLASKLRLCLVQKDWEHVRKSLASVLCAEPCLLPVDQLVELAESVASICISDDLKCSDVGQNLTEWLDILLRIMFLASSDVPKLALIETNLQLSLARVPLPGLRHWTKALRSSTAVTPKHLKAILLLLIWRSSRPSGAEIVSSLVSRALGRQTQDVDSAVDVWHDIVGLTETTWCTSGTHARLLGSAQLSCLLAETGYLGSGAFRCADVTRSRILNESGALVFHTLYVDIQNCNSSHDRLVLDRALIWLECADAVLGAKGSVPEGPDLLFVVAVVTTILCEVSVARSGLVRSMTRAIIAGSSRSTQSSALYAAVVSVVLASSNFAKSSELTIALDSISSVFSRKLSLHQLMAYAETLLKLPSARRTLLAHASSQLLGRVQGIESPSPDSAAEVFDEGVRCGLFAFVALVCSADWGDCERLAWAQLSDMIVCCRPALSASVRSWLYEEINRAIKERRLSQSTGERMLRVVVVRLFHVVRPNQQGYPSFLPSRTFEAWFADDTVQSRHTRQIEDVVGLFGLLVSLLHFCASLNSEWQLVIDRWRSAIACAIDTWCDSDTTSQEVRFALPSVVVDDNTLLCNTALYCLSWIVQEAIAVTFCYEGDGLLLLTNARSTLCEKERLELKESAHDQPLPRWVCASYTNISYLGSSGGSALFLQCSRLAAIDLTIELMAGRRWDYPSTVPKSYLFRLHGLLRERQRLGHFPSDHSTMRNHYDQDAVLEALGNWHIEATRTFEDSIFHPNSLDETGRIFEAVLDLSDAMKNITTNDGEGSSQMQQCADIIWRSYVLLCTEESAQRLISFLENQHHYGDDSPDIETVDGSDKTAGWLRMARSPDSIDCAIRRARVSTLEAAKTCFSSAIQRQLAHASAAKVSKTSCPISLVLVLRALETLSRDMRVGLDGSSGGLTHDIYELYLDCINSCCSIIMNVIDDLQVDQIGSVASACKSAVEFLQDIPCMFDIKRSAAFKNTLMLSLSTVPAIGRGLLRVAIFQVASASYPAALDLSWASSSWTILCLRHCAEYLCRDMTDRLTQQPEDPSEEPDDDQGMTANTALLVRQDSSVECGKAEMLVLNSERSSIWALTCVLQSMENDWEESQRIVQRNRDDRALVMNASADSYIGRRAKQLSAMVEEVRSLLSTEVELAHNSPVSKQTLAEIQPDLRMVFALPAVVKNRLCALVNRVLLVLQRSIRHILGIVRQGRRDGEPVIERLATAESLSCLLAWLPSSDDGCLTTQLQRWQEKEQGLVAQPMVNGFPIADSSTLRRFGQIFARVDEVATTLGSLDDFLRKTGKGDKNKKVSQVEEAIDLSIKKHFGEWSLRDLVSRKVELLSSQRPPKKRKVSTLTPDMERRARKERTKRIVRSRNPVVDKWLQRDRDLDDERNDNDDAFADLEDFLVDG